MVFQQNEFDVLEKVMVCPPTYMRITNVINETQKFYKDENIDVEIANRQHEQFVRTLEEHGVKVLSIDPKEELNEQVFTRDIGFTIDDTVYISKMGSEIREHEVELLEEFLKNRNFNYMKLTTPSIEGGDVVLAGDRVWIGISERTTYQAVDALQEIIQDRKLMPIPISEDILHLDCAFNLLSEKEGLIYTSAFKQRELDRLMEMYDLIEVSDDEQFTLGTNVFSIGNKTVISLPENKNVNSELRARGYQVIEVEFSEIIKSGGAFRCCTLPIRRTNR
ncbi:dimethylarginine dimethylaminohydrolase family protein [Gracilibacillus dipsosauri]|uniref:dimethylarginine dimethylaminohydrolase family protein n=1 Tax=Gracilibacillus dipsosauri TaxID=178340 RepID=UPI0024090788